MGRHQTDPTLGTIDLTAIEIKLYKYNDPLTPKQTKYFYGLLKKKSHIFYMSTMGVYSRTIVDQQFAKYARGAGCLLRDSARGVYAIQIYNVETSILLCEQVISMDQIIFIDIYDRMLLIVQSDGHALLLEFIDQTEVLEICSVIEGIRTKSIQLPLMKRNLNKRNVEISNPVDAPPPIPNLLTKSDILVLSRLNQKPKKNITKVDISSPTDFKHVQHGGNNQFAELTDNPKLKIETGITGKNPMLNNMAHCPIPTPSAVENCLYKITNTAYAVPMKLQENKTPPPLPPLPPSRNERRKISTTSTISSTSSIQSEEQQQPLVHNQPTTNMGANGPNPPTPPPPPPPPPMIQSTAPVASIAPNSTKHHQKSESTIDFMSELQHRIHTMKKKPIEKNGEQEYSRHQRPADGDPQKSISGPQTIGDVMQTALDKLRVSIYPLDEPVDDTDIWPVED